MSKQEKPLSAKEQKAANKAATNILTDMIGQFIEKYQSTTGIGFDVSKLKERILEAQERPRNHKETGRPGIVKINLIELFLAKAHFPDEINNKMLAKYFDVNEQNVKIAVAKYELDTKHTLEKIKGVVTRFAALPIREEFQTSVNLHKEAENEIATINLTLKTLRDPATGLLFKQYLESENIDYYIKALKEAELKKIKLLQVVTNMRAKVLEYFEYDQFINNVLKLVTMHAGVETAQHVQHMIENFLDTYGFGLRLPETNVKTLPPAKKQ
jgi:hypothetical protein